MTSTNRTSCWRRAASPAAAGTSELRPVAAPATTFAFMGTPEHYRASHAPYIAEVRRRLQARDIYSIPLDPASFDGRRAATLMLHLAQEAFPTPVPEEALLSWDEENGWSLAFHDPETGTTGAPFREGLRVLPGPDDVAVWAVVLLTHPETTISRDQSPFRDHAAPDPEFEHQLARYTAG